MELTFAGYGTESILVRNGCVQHYWLREAPRGDAPLVMFIHGAGVDHRMWASQIDAFAEYYHVLTYDIRGHGQSRPAGDYSFAAIVDDAFALLDHLNPAKVALVGLSMGGNIAQEMVFRNPGRFAGMICADCTCNTLVPWPDRFLTPIYAALFGPLLALYSMKALINDMGAASALSPDGRRYVTTAMAQLSKPELARVMTTLLAALHHQPGCRVPVPQLLCHGDHDRLGNIQKVMPLWRRRDSNSEFVVIPNASHCANIDNPAVFNRIVLDWLARIFA